MDNLQLPAYPVKRFEDGEPYWEGGLTKLEVFTMAAMQGLCTGKDANDLSVSDVEGIAWGAGEIAQRTLHRLSELSKQQ